MEFGVDVLVMEGGIGSGDELFLELGDVLSAYGEACGKVVAAEVLEEGGVFAEVLEEGELGDGADGAFADALVDGDDDGGAVVLFGDAGGDDGDDAGVPFIGGEDDGFVFEDLGIFEDVVFDVLRVAPFDLLPLDIVEVEFFGEVFGGDGVADEEEFDAFAGVGDAAEAV